MGKLSAATCFDAKPDRSGRGVFLGDGDGLSLRIRGNGTRTWVIEYPFEGTRRSFPIGILDKQGAAGESISSWLDNGRLTLAQARAIAGPWKADRHAGRDPVAVRYACLAAPRTAEEAPRDTAARKAAQPTVHDVVAHFAARHRAGKRSGPAMRGRLHGLATELGDRKLRDLKRRDVIDALERVAEGRIKGRTAKHLAGEVLVQATRRWRFAATRASPREPTRDPARR